MESTPIAPIKTLFVCSAIVYFITFASFATLCVIGAKSTTPVIEISDKDRSGETHQGNHK